MFTNVQSYLKNLRPLTGFLLIFVFLVLSYCPLRRALQELITGVHESAKAIDFKGPVSAICLDLINRSGKSTIAVPQSETRMSSFAATVIILFCFSQFFYATRRGCIVFKYISPNAFRIIPLYLKNSVWLI